METRAESVASNSLSKAERWLKTEGYQEPSLSFYSGVDKTKNWFPEQLSPWFYLSGYSLLSKDGRRRYNQLYATGTSEVFAVFEVDFICRILKKMARKENLPQEIKETIARIDVEEEKHARVFHRLNCAAAPEYYNEKNKGRFLATKADGFGVWLLNVIAEFPEVFGVWVWVALIFEERSILYSKFYQSASDQELDSKFKEIHRLHLIEEVNHVKLDELLVEEFYLKLPWWKRQITRYFLKRVLNSFRSPRRMSYAIADVLKKEFPSETSAINLCLQQLPELRSCESFQNLLFGPAAFKRTQRLLNRCPELADLVSS